MNADGTFRYFAPNADFNGADSFTYQMTDGFNGESQAVVTLTISPVDDLPVASDKNYSVNEDTPLIITAPDLLAATEREVAHLARRHADEDQLSLFPAHSSNE